MGEETKVVELVKELQKIAKETKQSIYVDVNNYGHMAVRMIYIRNNYSLDNICIAEKEEEKEIDGVKLTNVVLGYIPREEFDSKKHKAVG